jgi:hypothetical protein
MAEEEVMAPAGNLDHTGGRELRPEPVQVIPPDRLGEREGRQESRSFRAAERWPGGILLADRVGRGP